MHLFVAFILKAVAVFIKDFVLYDEEETDICQSSVSILHTVLLMAPSSLASLYTLLKKPCFLLITFPV